MNKEPHYLFDMLDAIKLVQSYTSGKTKQHLVEDIFLQDAVRRLEILGEAARRISDKTRVDFEIIWDAIQQELPKQIPILEKEIARRTINQ